PAAFTAPPTPNATAMAAPTSATARQRALLNLRSPAITADTVLDVLRVLDLSHYALVTASPSCHRSCGCDRGPRLYDYPGSIRAATAKRVGCARLFIVATATWIGISTNDIAGVTSW